MQQISFHPATTFVAPPAAPLCLFFRAGCAYYFELSHLLPSCWGFKRPTTHESLSSNVSPAEPRLDVGGLTCSIHAVTCPGQYRRRLQQYASTHSAVQGSVCIYYHRLPLDIFLFYCNISKRLRHCCLLGLIQGHPPLYCSRVFFKSCRRSAATQRLQHDRHVASGLWGCCSSWS